MTSLTHNAVLFITVYEVRKRTLNVDGVGELWLHCNELSADSCCKGSQCLIAIVSLGPLLNDTTPLCAGKHRYHSLCWIQLFGKCGEWSYVFDSSLLK